MGFVDRMESDPTSFNTSDQEYSPVVEFELDVSITKALACSIRCRGEPRSMGGCERGSPVSIIR